MNFPDNLAPNTERGLTIDLVGKQFAVRGLSPVELLQLEGICSMETVGTTVMIEWYELQNLFSSLKAIGYSEASYTTPEVGQKVEALLYYQNLRELMQTREVELWDEIPFNGRLFKIQKNGVAFLLNRRIAALFDEMGTGKTIEAVYAYGVFRNRLRNEHFLTRCLVIAPKAVKLEWRDAFQRFLGLTAVPIEDLLDEAIDRTEIILVHYEQLIDRKIKGETHSSKVLRVLNSQNFTNIIIDEGHFVKNRLAKRTKSILELIRRRNTIAPSDFLVGKIDGRDIYSSKQLPFLWFLTGTPMEKPKDIYVMLKTAFGSRFASFNNFMSAFTEFETKYFYRRRIHVPVGVKNEDKLRSLVGQMSLRRMRSEIVEIPSLDRVVRINLDSAQRRQFDNIMTSGDNPLTRIVRGIQYCNSPQLLDIRGESPKYEALLQIIRETPKKVVVWTSFRDAVEKITTMLKNNRIPAVSLLGGSDIEQVKEEFLRPETQVIVSTVAKGAVGINFMKSAFTVIYVEKPFSYTQYVQSRDRVMRVDRDTSEPVLFVNLMIENSTDDLLQKVMDDKTSLNAMILGPNVQGGEDCAE